MKLKNIICIMMMLCGMALSGRTLTVSLDGNAEFTSIQSAINASSNGDIVLVYPGTYYENVNFLDKRIELFSLEATTGDSTYISTTIIDGGRTAPCVTIENGLQNAHLRGFTLTNGLGAVRFMMEIRVGGGILIKDHCRAIITNCNIWGNYAGMGAGMTLYESTAALRGVKIHHNYASTTAGGILIWGHHSYLPNPGISFDPHNRCSIYENYGGNPTDIRVLDLRQNLQINLDMVSVDAPSEFYIQRNSNFIATSDFHDTIDYQRAYRSEVDHDLYVGPEGNDENSGLSPAQALRSITVAMHRIKPNENNRNTVRILPGNYTINDQIFPIPLKSHVNLMGVGLNDVIIQYEANNGIPASDVVFSSKQHDLMLSGLTIRGNIEDTLAVCPLSIYELHDSIIKDIVIENFFLWTTGIIYADTRNCTLQNFTLRNCITELFAFEDGSYIQSGIMRDCVFENIESLYPGDDPWGEPAVIGIWVREWLKMENCIFRDIRVQNLQPILGVLTNNIGSQINIEITNCIFEDLRCNWVEGTIFFQATNTDQLKINNCTFVNNYGATAAITTSGRVTYKNNIFYNPDAPYEMLIPNTFNAGFLSYIDIDYNLIYGGNSRVLNSYPGNMVTYRETNINADPMFASTNPSDSMFLRLRPNSPCINSGTPDTTGLNLPSYDLAGNWRIWDGRIDMGCFEYGSEPWVSVDDPTIPHIPAVSLGVWPNPFKVFTNIKVNVPQGGLGKAESASIAIYNIKGQKVKTIALDPSKAGEQFTYWDGRDSDNRLCSSGIYLLNLTVNGRNVSSKKVTFVR